MSKASIGESSVAADDSPQSINKISADKSHRWDDASLIGANYVDAVIFHNVIYLLDAENSIHAINIPIELHRKAQHIVLQEFVITRKITFVAPREVQYILYDIETADPAHSNQVPRAESSTSFVSVICAMICRAKSDGQLDLEGARRVAFALSQAKIGGITTNDGRTIEMRRFRDSFSICHKFMKFIRDISRNLTTFVIGFNSSSDIAQHKYGAQQSIQGYDLHFIVSKMGIHRKIDYHNIGRSFACTGHVDIAGICAHFVDARPWLIGATAALRQITEGTSLKAFLDAAHLPPKQNSGLTYAQMGEIMCAMQSDDHESIPNCTNLFKRIVLYCQYDCEAVGALLNHYNYVRQYNALREIMAHPYSYCAHHTQPNALQFYLARIMYEAGLPFEFHRASVAPRRCCASDCANIAEYVAPDSIEPTMCMAHICEGAVQVKHAKFRGAYNMDVPANGVFSTKRTAMFDFTALYPTTISAYGISPWQFVANTDDISQYNSREYTSIHNDPSNANIHDPRFREWFVFRKTHDAFLDAIANLLRLRAYHRARAGNDALTAQERAYSDALQIAIKVCVNSLYGLLGLRSAYWFNIYVAAAVTLGGRIAINHAIGVVRDYGEPVFVDTDSCAFTLRDEFGAIDARELSAQINDKIRAQLRDTCEAQLYDFHFEHMFSRIFISKRKNYLKLIEGMGSFQHCGFQFRRTSAYIRERTLAFVRETFMLPRDEWCARVGAFIGEIEREIRNADDAQLERYAIIQKLSGRDLVAKHLRARFADCLRGQDEARVMPVRIEGARNSLAKSERYVPIERINRDEIDVDELIARCFSSNLVRFFPDARAIFNKCIFVAEHRLDPDRLNLRIESLSADETRISRQYVAVDFAQIGEYVPSSTVSVHEIIADDIHRMHFDIDGHGSQDQYLQVLDRITREISVICGIQDEPIILSASCGVKQSYHIIYERAISRALNEIVAKILVAKGFASVDAGIYTIGHSLRVPECGKWNDTTLVARKFVLPEGVQLIDCLVTYVPTNCTPVRSEMIYNLRESPFTSRIAASQEIVLSEVLRNHLDELFGKSWRIEYHRSGAYIDPRGATCPICERRHDHDKIALNCDSDKSWSLYCPRANGTHRVLRIKLGAETARRDRATIMREIVRTYAGIYGAHEVAQDRYIGSRIDDVAQDKSLVFIRAQLGSGKTRMVAAYMAGTIASDPCARWIVISNRRTLSTAFGQQFREANLIDYRDEQLGATIATDDAHRGIIVQTNSLDRIADHEREGAYVLIDEAESVLLQFANSGGDPNANAATNAFETILRGARRIIAMDACLTSYTREIIRSVAARNISREIIIEHWRPAFARQTIVQQCSDQCRDEMENYYSAILREIEAGHRVISACCVCSLADEITHRLRAHDPPYRVLKLTGADRDIVRRDDGTVCTMFALKEELFRDINANIEQIAPQLLIYTTTMTAGVSIDAHYFDCAIHWYGANVNPLDFVQATSRVRWLSRETAPAPDTLANPCVRIYLAIRANNVARTLVDYAADKFALKHIGRGFAHRLAINAHDSFIASCQYAADIRLKFADEYILSSLIENGYNITILNREPARTSTFKITTRLTSEVLATIVANDDDIARANACARNDVRGKRAFDAYIREHVPDADRAMYAMRKVDIARYIGFTDKESINALTSAQIEALQDEDIRLELRIQHALTRTISERVSLLNELINTRDEKVILPAQEDASVADGVNTSASAAADAREPVSAIQRINVEELIEGLVREKSQFEQRAQNARKARGVAINGRTLTMIIADLERAHAAKIVIDAFAGAPNGLLKTNSAEYVAMQQNACAALSRESGYQHGHTKFETIARHILAQFGRKLAQVGAKDRRRENGAQCRVTTYKIL